VHARVSKDEEFEQLMVRDGAIAGVACANLAMERLLTMREYP
jgi:hypothetical protein